MVLAAIIAILLIGIRSSKNKDTGDRAGKDDAQKVSGQSLGDHLELMV